MIVSNKKLPKISIVMLTFNGGDGVRRALDSVSIQKYPKDLIEIIIVDNDSKDNSVEIAKKYTKRVTISRKSAYENRADGMRSASGDYIFMILEQDMEFKSEYFLRNMVMPLLEDESLAASFTRDYPRKDQPWVTRFISYDPNQRDPLFEFLTPSIKDTIVEKRNGYFLCNLTMEKLPPITHMLFKKSILKSIPVWKQKKDFDHDTVIGIIKAGNNKFAYVPEAGLYHHHAKNLKELVDKRVRNLNNHFFPYNNTTEYKWIDLTKRKNVLKLIVWVIYANLIFPAFIRGLTRTLKFRDRVFLLEPIIVIATTDAILWAFMKNEKGRLILKSSFKRLID